MSESKLESRGIKGTEILKPKGASFKGTELLIRSQGGFKGSVPLKQIKISDPLI